MCAGVAFVPAPPNGSHRASYMGARFPSSGRVGPPGLLQVLAPELPFLRTTASPEADAYLAVAATNAPLPEPLAACTVSAMHAAITRRAARLLPSQQTNVLAVLEGGRAAQVALTNITVRRYTGAAQAMTY